VKSGQLSVYFVLENIDQIDMLKASIFMNRNTFFLKISVSITLPDAFTISVF